MTNERTHEKGQCRSSDCFCFAITIYLFMCGNNVQVQSVREEERVGYFSGSLVVSRELNFEVVFFTLLFGC